MSCPYNVAMREAQIQYTKGLYMTKYRELLRHRDRTTCRKITREALTNLALVILNDFLLHPTTENDEEKELHDILGRRNEMPKNYIICSQRNLKA